MSFGFNFCICQMSYSFCHDVRFYAIYKIYLYRFFLSFFLSPPLKWFISSHLTFRFAIKYRWPINIHQMNSIWSNGINCGSYYNIFIHSSRGRTPTTSESVRQSSIGFYSCLTRVVYAVQYVRNTLQSLLSDIFLKQWRCFSCGHSLTASRSSAWDDDGTKIRVRKERVQIRTRSSIFRERICFVGFTFVW